MAEHGRQPDVEAALRVLHHWALGRHLRYSEHALHTAQAMGLDADDMADALAASGSAHVHRIEPDRDFPDRMVLVMRLRAAGAWIYAKVSLRMHQDDDVLVRSFHRRGM